MSCSFRYMIKNGKKTSTKNNSMTNDATSVATISVVSSFHDMASKSSLSSISDFVEIEKDVDNNLHRSKSNG